ncbi:hypothetical protein HY968_03450 [Candidatus Kaiserbacteria bacterium]|nr:hypothetical protein [Candidatus Kaiserbacteria bacterium]
MLPTSLAKKTKAELIEEYKQLLEKQKELEATAKEAYKPEHDELYKKVDAYSDETIERSVAQLRSTFVSALTKLADSLHSEVQKLHELKQAIEVSKQRLAFHYHVEVAAGLVEKMLADYEEQKQQLERDIVARRREWDRSQEEDAYQSTVVRKRAEEANEEKFQKREAAIEERESQFKAEVKLLEELKERAESIPQEIEKEVAKREAEFKKRLEGEFKQREDFARKESELTTKAFESDAKNLRDQLARAQGEIVAVRKDAELANKKAQELAIRVVESAGYQPKTLLHESGAQGQ